MAAIKICGLTRAGDAGAAAAAGALFGGVILAPGSPRTVDATAVHEIFAGTSLARCGVFVNEPFDSMVALIDELCLNVAQLHGDETPELAERLRTETGVETWKAIRPRDGAEFGAEVYRFASSIDGLLLDGWSAVARGGTGARFPWSEVAAHRDLLPGGVRLVVAGGLTPENVGEVIGMLRPDVVDVSSGVERAPGVKDDDLIRKFAGAVRSAAAWQGAG